MSAVCPHGFAPAECLICQTLGTKPQVQVEGGRRGKGGAGDAIGRSSPPERGQRPDQPNAVYPPGTSRPTRSLSSYAAMALIGVIVFAVVAWFLAGAVFAILRVLELLVVAGLAGWVGYKVGHYRGRHSGP